MNACAAGFLTLACVPRILCPCSQRPKLMYEYFKQLFAQVCSRPCA